MANKNILRRTILDKITSLPHRVLYVFAAVIIVFSGLVWWRPHHASATTDTFTTSGTWTVPAGVSSADFEAWGGGGAGGGASTSSTGGGGGAGGQYAIKSGFSVTPGDNYTITVATSVAGSAGANGSPGNPSLVINPSSTTIVSASGGTGGMANNGAGGSNISTGCIGDTLGGASCYLGGSGAAGSGSSGGGGGGAGSTGAGGNASGTTAGSGTSTNGGNGGTGNPSGTSAAGQAGLNYGGGGSGGVKRNGSSIAGGAGAQGLVTVTYTANSAPSSPTLTAPSSGATGVSTTPTFSFNDTDPESDDIQFKINLFQSNCTTSVTTYDMASGQTGWSPTFNGSAGSGLTYTNTTSNSGVSFTPSSALSNSTTYCWSVSAKDPGGSNTTTTSSTQSFTTVANTAPNSPTLTAPSSGATGVSTTPTFSFNDTDPESDDIQFKINLFQSNCTTSVTTYDMASGQTGWSPTFNGSAGSGLTYTNTTSNSGVSFTPSSALSNSTTYCWSVSAKDPGGSNTYTTSGTQSFTTAAAGPADQVNIGGGVNITGGTNVY